MLVAFRMLALNLFDITDPAVETLWKQLDAPTYYLSWSFVSAWLSALPEDKRPQLAIALEDGVVKAGFLLGKRRLFRVLPAQAMYLNASGFDELGLAHSALLRAPGSHLTLDQIVAILPASWDELFLPAIDPNAFPELGRMGARGGYRIHVDKEASAPYVDLDAVRGVEGGYLAMLDPSVRAQIGRAKHDLGALTVEIATDARQAMDIYGELLRLHARERADRGERGVFADPWFEQFHRGLITERIASGEIQLVRVSSATGTVGCLYNFVHNGVATAYQSAFASFDDPHVEPGFLCHEIAVAHAATAGLMRYELRATSARLATNATRLTWLCIHRPSVRFAIEDRIRDLGRVVRQRRLAA